MRSLTLLSISSDGALSTFQFQQYVRIEFWISPQNAVRDVFPPGRCRGEKQFQRTRCHRSLGWILCETKTLVFLGDYFANDVTRWFLSRRRFQVTPKLECGHWREAIFFEHRVLWWFSMFAKGNGQHNTAGKNNSLRLAACFDGGKSVVKL